MRIARISNSQYGSIENAIRNEEKLEVELSINYEAISKIKHGGQ